MVTQSDAAAPRDCDQRDDCDINKEADERNRNYQQRDQVVVVGQGERAAGLVESIRGRG
jgi:hypothetical protein